jgi:UDP-N-acetylglucosamine diphosphorylase/glucosamine-1-phosphate N-acetyltransferase
MIYVRSPAREDERKISWGFAMEFPLRPCYHSGQGLTQSRGGAMTVLCIFEDEGWRRLLPLTHLRPLHELRCGMHSLAGRILNHYPGTRASLFCRGGLKEAAREDAGLPVNERPAGPCLFVNGRALLEGPIPLEGGEEIGVKGDVLVYARLGAEKAGKIDSSLFTEGGFLAGGFARELERGGARVVDADAPLIRYPWDLVTGNARRIELDFFDRAASPGVKPRGGAVAGTVMKGAHLVEPARIVIGKGSVVRPGSVLDAAQGPIRVGENVTIYPNVSIEGPAFIGDNTLIKSGAAIYGGTSIGEVCKAGGEIESSIMHACSNKQHFGFLGHSYVGMWCNIGAGTSTSDLKNNYGSIRVELEDGVVDSGLTFFGMVMGDHVKTGIHTMFNTGSVVGVMASVYGGGLPPKYIPSFSWVSPEGMSEYDPGKAIGDARKVMGRRNRELTPAKEKLLLEVFERTKAERRARGAG